MNLRRRWAVLAIVTLVAGCEEPVTTVVARKPAALVVLASPPAAATVGASAGIFSVKVTDAAGAAVPGALVAFRVTRGGGLLSPSIDTSDAAGEAATTYTVATFPGVNDIAAFVTGAARATVSVTGAAGAARAVTLSTARIRYTPLQDSALVTATPRDTFANAAGTPVTWLARDSTLVSVTPAFTSSAIVRVLRRPGSTWLVASSGSAADSIPVVVTDSTSTPCSFIAAPNVLALGASLPFDTGITCIRSAVAGAEYVVVAHLNTPAIGVAQSISILGDGIATPATSFPIPLPDAAAGGATAPADVRDFAFERGLREREHREIAPRVAGARALLGQRSNLRIAPVEAMAHVLPSVAREGQILQLNTNAEEFCSAPEIRTARIVAVTSGAIVMADVNNPEGGFTDEEYRAFGIALDTLVTPVDTTAFGAPTDIDHNRRVGIFFTRAVNELTRAGSGSVVLGFYYLRDLLPRTSAYGDCPGSNVGEMFYIMVPDTAGEVNSNRRSKAFVANTVVGTIGHEFQHLINASRRMYVTDAQQVDEEVWLNEGLSHIAEELIFFRTSGLAPRTNIDIAQLAPGTLARGAFDEYGRANLARYREYQRTPESTSPMAGNDDITTRGATWSFLRYLADRVRPSDGDFWRRLVNARTTGAVNLDSALAGTGVTTLSGLRDWSLSVVADDNPLTAGSTIQQPSWNFVSAMQALGGGLAYALNPRLPANQISTQVGLAGGGSAYLRFAVPQNQEALIRATASGGAPPPTHVKLSVVRIK